MQHHNLFHIKGLQLSCCSTPSLWCASSNPSTTFLVTTATTPPHLLVANTPPQPSVLSLFAFCVFGLRVVFRPLFSLLSASTTPSLSEQRSRVLRHTTPPQQNTMDPSFCPNCHGDKLSSQRLCEACTPSFAPSFSVDLGGSGSNHHHLRHSAAGASASNSNIDSLMTDDGETSLMFHQQPVVRSAGGVAVMHAASVGTGLGLGGGFGGSGIASTSSLLAPSLAPPRAVAPMKQKRAPGSHADRRRTASGMAPSLTAGAHLMTVPTAAAPAAATKSHTAAAVAAAATSYNHALKPATTAPAWVTQQQQQHQSKQRGHSGSLTQLLILSLSLAGCACSEA